jgi:hypothetical protein
MIGHTSLKTGQFGVRPVLRPVHPYQPRPFKPVRYPWFPKEKRTTIAAGILHNEGVLLCSDTQIEAGAMKMHGPKMGFFDCVGGKIAFAMAGNVNFGLSAIQKCKRSIVDVDSADVRDEIEAVLAEEYDRIVFRHPSYATSPGSISYWFLIAIYSEPDKVNLFCTSENTMHEVQSHECIGIGQELAQYVLSSASLRKHAEGFDANLGERQASVAASYMLAKVKDHVPGCGGLSRFLAVRKDGTIAPIDAFPLDQLAAQSRVLDWTARRVLVACTESSLVDAEFEGMLDVLAMSARSLRNEWRKNIDGDPLFKSLGEQLAKLGHQSTTGDP